MATKREEMKALRLKAMGVVGEQMDANAEMFRRIISAGSKVSDARDAAETAHMGALEEQVGDLKEMADDMAEFSQAAPPKGGSTGTKPLTGSVKPAETTLKPSQNSAALAALLASQPNPPAEKQTITAAEVGDAGKVIEEDGNAYHGTAPPTL